MDHVVCLDAGAKELENLINGNKSMIIRGSDARDLHYRCVNEGDFLYFMSCMGDGEVKARGIVSYVHNTERLSVEASYETIIRNQDKLQLPDKQFESIAGKKYLVLVEVEEIEVIEPIRIDKARFTSQDDWLQVGNINTLHLAPLALNLEPRSKKTSPCPLQRGNSFTDCPAISIQHQEPEALDP